MAFINRYSREKVENQYAFSKEFIENGEKFILAIGTDSDEKGLVSCIDSETGDVIWEKIYWNEEITSSPFVKIIQIKDKERGENAYQYIILLEAAIDLLFISIDKSGNILWSKQPDFKFGGYSNLFMEPKFDLSGFYFAFSKFKQNENNTISPAFIGDFNQEGELTIGKSIIIDQQQELVLTGITNYEKGVALSGKIKNDKGEPLNAVILDFNLNLKQEPRTLIIEKDDIDIYDIKDLGDKFLISGYSKTEDSLFVSIIEDLSSFEINYFQTPVISTKGLMFSEKGIYVLSGTSSNLSNVLYHLDWNFSMQWAKNMHVDGEVDIISINNNLEAENILITLYNRAVQTVIGLTDNSFNSCKTNLLKTPKVGQENYILKGITITLEDAIYKIIKINEFQKEIKSERIEYCPTNINIDLEKSIIEANPDCILPSGGISTITVQLYGIDGNPISNGSSNVVINTSLGTVSNTTDNNNGTYTATLSSALNGTATLSFTVDGNNANHTTTVMISKDCNDAGTNVDLNLSTIYASPTQIMADGISTSTITVNLLDSFGNPVTTNETVSIIFANGNTTYLASFISGTQDQGGGVYSAILQSSNNNQENVILSFSIGATEAIGNTATVDIYKGFTLSPLSKLQSTSLYMQAAGSLGNDGSLSGVHLRWVLKGNLGNIHLPKGNNATSDFNFNKPNDFVRIYRAPYVPQYIELDFQSSRPNVVDNNNHLWIYYIEENPYYVYFKNLEKYNEVKMSIDPLTSSYSFIQAYGNELIEVDHKTTLSFAVELESSTSSTVIEAEALSVENNNLSAIKYLTARRTFTGTGRFVEENIRTIRFKTTSNNILKIRFELYVSSLEYNTSQNQWMSLGAYALTTSDSEAIHRLEDLSGSAPIEGQWPRFNDGETVNKANYLDRWNGQEVESYDPEPEYYEYYDRRLKTTVRRFIELSNDNPNNPTAIESIPFSNILPDDVTAQEDDVQDISNLTMIQLASMDYHLARVLGLGHIDRSINQTEEKYIYLAEYFTVRDVNDSQSVTEEVQHLYLSLPTAMSNERLPKPVNLLEPILGTNNPDGNISNLLDEEGYLYDGKQRFISLVNEEIEDNQTNSNFYEDTNEFSTSENTEPVYVGLEYKRFEVGNPDAASWRKPELSNNSEFYNYSTDNPLTSDSYETVPLMLPNSNETLFLHREREEGWHRYGSYGINWFSRSQMSAVFWDLETRFKPQNRLLPPSNIKTCLVIEESPLLLTSADEQILFDNITNEDKTLIRLTFDHNINQDRLIYQINDESMASYDDPVEDKNSIFKDSREVFADKINLYFRNRPPQTVTGKIKSVEAHANNALAVIRTESYVLNSTGETVNPIIEANQLSHYVGSVFMINTIKYIVYEVTQSTVSDEGPIFTVYKQVVSEAMMNGTDPDPTMPLNLPEFNNLDNPNTIVTFNTVENMLTGNNWQVGESTEINKLDFQIEIGYDSVEDIHREVIEEESISGIPEQILEKSRGIWKTAVITEELRLQSKLPEDFDDQGNVITEMRHIGMYKITFPNYELAHHPQFDTHNVDWYQGIVRIHTQNNPDKKRKILEVVKIENIGIDDDLVIYAIDPQYPVNVPDVSEVEGFDPILTGEQEVNFYPGYRVYLYHDVAHHLTEDAILPSTGEGLKYSIFGLQTEDPSNPEDATNSSEYYRSKISQPSAFFAQEIIRPEIPILSNGEEFVYATRPDTFGKSTFTLSPGFKHIPHGVQFYRSNDDAILNALYNPTTVIEIKEKLKDDIDSKFHLVKRWQNLLGFDFGYDGTFQTDNEFFYYPEEGEGYRFPMPDKYQFYKGIIDILEYRNDNYGTSYALDVYGNLEDYTTDLDIEDISFNDIVIPELLTEGLDEVKFIDYMKSAVFNVFTPLTEIPIMYEHVNPSSYQPISKKQVVRDASGNLMLPSHDDFDMAPMAKLMSQESIQNLQEDFPDSEIETGMLFTDFNLDGTSDNLYFYAIREMGNTMQLGEYSTIIGPIKLVNTKPPQTPEIKRVLPVLKNVNLNILPGVSVEVNAYPKVQNVKQLKLYRTLNPNNALSVRTMDLIKTIDLETDNQLLNNIWKIKDEFTDLGYVPYGDPLYYRVTALREIQYADGSNEVGDSHPLITEYAPSEASKLLISSIVENANPESPVLQYNFDIVPEDVGLLNHVILKWDKKVHNGKYHVYKMNNQGNWVKIHTLVSNEIELQLLLADTSLNNGSLTIKSEDGNPIYHHFKVVSENSASMLSTEDKILTIPNVNSIAENEGIGDMIIENTNIVR